MDLSLVKFEILEALFPYDEPVSAARIAKDTGKDRKAVQMHLIGLVRMGYAGTPQKGLYIISKKGKEQLGLREVTKEKASSILAHMPAEKVFHFYAKVGKPIGVYASDLLDFCDKIGKIDVECVEFHFNRGDLEAWFMFLGDEELAKKIGALRRRSLGGEELRGKICKVTECRCRVLSEIAG